MADNEEVEVTQRTGNEWEVVQLTASAYNASPSPDDELSGTNEVKSSGTMFMSGHFIFPPSQHENLPVEPEKNENGSEDGISELVDDENLYTETTGFSSVHSETAISNSSVVDESEGIDELFDSSMPTLSNPVKGDDHDGAELPCEAWWKRRAISIYVRAKETNTLWSIIIAATVMGLVVIGHRWQDLHLKLQLGINDEKIARLIAPVSRLKDAIIGGNRRGSLIHGSVYRER